MKTIRLSSGHLAKVSDRDYPKVSKFSWFPLRENRRTNVRYARTKRPDGSTVLMHQLIMGKGGKGRVVDHRNGNGLDNRRSNLRVTTHRQNSLTRRKRRRK